MEITLTSENFENEVLKSDIPVLVDFWASWCGPCKMIAPNVEKIAEKYQGKIKIGKLNVDDEPMIADKYKIVSIPTLMYFENGNLMKKTVGYLTVDEIENFIK